ncbi:hypothetical protein MMC18_001995 [Xylographa bjoerkii]|nr:hypothetical protein [Xylographa bjoerkii]
MAFPLGIASLCLLLPLVWTAPTGTSPPASTSIQYLPTTQPTEGVLNSNITTYAGGSVPNVTKPLVLTSAAYTGFQLLLWLEELEVALYYEGLKNLTNQWANSAGLPPNTLEIIAKTAAQEDIHVATLQGVLEINKVPNISPCKYIFPANTPQEFFAIAGLITPANYGSIIGLETEIASTDPATVFSATSILATEVRHEVFIRSTDGEIPNPAPFDTGIPPEWAFNIALAYVVPGSCKVLPALPHYPTLSLDPKTGPMLAPATYPPSLNFTWNAADDWVAQTGDQQIYVAWINLANQPQYTNLNRTGAGSGTTDVPKGFENVAYCALTILQPNNFVGVAAATLAGPLAIPIS